jgi:thiol-disulfide isomerase/thioredoxin
VQVNPWITLFAIDLPAIVALIIFRPTGHPEHSEGSGLTAGISIFGTQYSLRRTVVTICLVLFSLSVSTYALTANEPAVVTFSYEVLEPTEWIGKELPILDYIDIDEDLTKGNWLILLYHYDCPDCQEAIVKLEQMARDLQGNEDFLQIALIEMPPYGNVSISENTPCRLGKLPETKEWFGATPIVILLQKNRVKQAWEGESPGIDTLFNSFLN